MYAAICCVGNTVLSGSGSAENVAKEPSPWLILWYNRGQDEGIICKGQKQDMRDFGRNRSVGDICDAAAGVGCFYLCVLTVDKSAL